MRPVDLFSSLLPFPAWVRRRKRSSQGTRQPANAFLGFARSSAAHQGCPPLGTEIWSSQMIIFWTQVMLPGLVFGPWLAIEIADLKSKAAKEAAEYVVKKFGKEVAEESAETLARKIEIYTAK